MKLFNWWPWVSKKYLRQVELDYIRLLEVESEKTKALRDTLVSKYKEKEAAVSKLVDKLSSLTWRRDERRYCLTLSFDPRVIGCGAYERRELEIIAEHFGHQVESDILRAKFIHEAEDDRYQRRGYC